MWRRMLRLSARSATVWNVAKTHLLNISGERHMAFAGADRSRLEQFSTVLNRHGIPFGRDF